MPFGQRPSGCGQTLMDAGGRTAIPQGSRFAVTRRRASASRLASVSQTAVSGPGPWRRQAGRPARRHGGCLRGAAAPGRSRWKRHRCETAQRLHHVAQRARRAAGDVAGEARRQPRRCPQQCDVGGEDVAHVVEVALRIEVADPQHRGLQPASMRAICPAKEGSTKSSRCPGPVWLNGRATISRASPAAPEPAPPRP